ncbi:histidinol-phosphate transaminase [Legionella pneumophila serogroup 1]|uniref:histidinol-phosphate transaminase n=2 Tax=Legionella pneumophila TaxID=446 RepID=UPI00048756DD|nr:histidinol-phosphate transaminase [Legionella pneumophila]AMQ28260.1 histidinol-phosphate aminotransferase [Legionella pneumophila subsp. pneumophila]AMV14769.1 Histidinol-phosphate aminotransferase 2 [Legionella pneumophila]ANN92964.1 histidinol-phosphate transaminase [Legionella pneumophila]AOW56774.1 histidinol-phosphate transaminase [Legionella pneumophila subsp. pneumophila]AOW60298.1 histidinol-phosphate transaminase [Legionella pneumophila subsp. pneumophila]
MSIDFQQLPHAGIRSLIPYVPGKSIEELAKEKGITDIIKLASNENPLGCSPLALSAIQTMSSHYIATYPSPWNHPLMSKLASYLKVKPEQLFLSNGSDYLFNILLNCFALHTDRHILTHDYAFSTYAIQANSLQIPINSVPIGHNWEVNITDIVNACNQQTGIIFIANPNNPTGVLIQQEEIKYLLEQIPKSTLLVLDEAYYEFAASQLTVNSLDWLEEHPNLVVTRTFSKIYGMAGLRLGYAIANPSIINILKRVQLPFIVNQVALAAAYAAIDDDDFIQSSLKMNNEGMSQLQAGFNELNIKYLPSSCNFLTFDCEEDSIALYNYLLDNGIIVRPLHAYKMNNFIRVTIGTKEQNSRFLTALKNFYL